MKSQKQRLQSTVETDKNWRSESRTREDTTGRIRSENGPKKIEERERNTGGEKPTEERLKNTNQETNQATEQQEKIRERHRQKG